jgi:hypothetical protein
MLSQLGSSLDQDEEYLQLAAADDCMQAAISWRVSYKRCSFKMYPDKICSLAWLQTSCCTTTLQGPCVVWHRKWAARYKTWLFIELTPKGVVFSFLFHHKWALLPLQVPSCRDPGSK